MEFLIQALFAWGFLVEFQFKSPFFEFRKPQALSLGRSGKFLEFQTDFVLKSKIVVVGWKQYQALCNCSIGGVRRLGKESDVFVATEKGGLSWCFFGSNDGHNVQQHGGQRKQGG